LIQLWNRIKIILEKIRKFEKKIAKKRKKQLQKKLFPVKKFEKKN